MDYIHIGKIVATHGTNGEIVVQHALSKKVIFKDIEVIFIEEAKGVYIPYFIEKATAKNKDELFLMCEGVHSKESAHRFIKRNVWLRHEDFEKIADAASPIALIGYMVFNDAEPLAKVEEVIEQPHQVLLRILYQEKEVLVPLHEKTLNKIDRKKQEVHVSLPDGLLEIYLTA
ncbi:ribosome maturation factor RimM [Arachidicoccus sp.]|uniref:ribosome maturation factor RimM n=1 Tax=Arachidicoccus sp. TaxID=1872624 RepID=UPI003D1995BA